MKAKDLYKKLDLDFGIDALKDDWSFMTFNDFISPSFRQSSMGLVLDNTKEVNRVFTATIPDLDVLDQLLDSDLSDMLLFSHHAMGYDPSMEGFPFYDIPEDYLHRLRQKRIAFYVLHAPLDKNGPYSTSVSLANFLKLPIKDEFCTYMGIQCGVLCETGMRSPVDFAAYVKSMVGHEVKLTKNGKDTIHKGLVAIAAGGGNVDFAAREIAELGINLYLTGCTRRIPSFEPTVEFHRIAEANKINLVGATHYSTEKYACMAMVKYFRNLGLEAEFIEGRYYLEDL